MRKLILLVLLSAVGCSALFSPPRLAPAPANAGRRYSRAEIVADLDSMLVTFEHVHPALYTWVSRDSMARARASLIATLPDSARRDEVYVRFARLVALVGDAHTTIGLPGNETARYMAQGGRAFPLRFGLDADDRPRVVGAIGRYPDGIAPGDELVALNGIAADSLMQTLSLAVSGESDWWKRRIAVQSLGSLLRLHGVAAPYHVTVRDSAGVVHEVTLVGLTKGDIDEITAANRGAGATTARTTGANYTYGRLAGGVGYIDFFSMTGDLGSFRSRLAETFAQINRDSIHTLVIDLRSNGGGNSQFGDAMLGHFATSSYRMAAGKEWRASTEYRRFIRSGLASWVRWLRPEMFVPEGRKLFRAPVGTNVLFPEEPHAPETAEPRFRGPVCVLFGRGTFSSAMQTADAVQTFRLATTIGEPTGGLPTAFGEVYSFRLPNMAMVANVSSARYVRASGDTTDLGPVRPDIVVTRTAADIRAGRDPALEAARQCRSLSSAKSH